MEEGIVVATGMETELGIIAKMINEQENEMTPLQKRLGDLGKILSKAAVFLCLLLFLMGVLQHRNLLQMLLLSISLAVAAIPGRTSCGCNDCTGTWCGKNGKSQYDYP